MVFSRRDLSFLLPALAASSASGQERQSRTLPSRVYHDKQIPYEGDQHKKGRRFFPGVNQLGAHSPGQPPAKGGGHKITISSTSFTDVAQADAPVETNRVRRSETARPVARAAISVAAISHHGRSLPRLNSKRRTQIPGGTATGQKQKGEGV